MNRTRLYDQSPSVVFARSLYPKRSNNKCKQCTNTRHSSSGTIFENRWTVKVKNDFLKSINTKIELLIKRVVEQIRHKSRHDVVCNAQTHEALSAATTQTPKPPPPTKASKLYVLRGPVLHGSGLLTSKQQEIKTFYQACRRSTGPAQRQTYVHASTNGLSRFLKISITGVVVSRTTVCSVYAHNLIRIANKLLPFSTHPFSFEVPVLITTGSMS